MLNELDLAREEFDQLVQAQNTIYQLQAKAYTLEGQVYQLELERDALNASVEYYAHVVRRQEEQLIAARRWGALWKDRSKFYRALYRVSKREFNDLGRLWHQARSWARAWKAASKFYRTMTFFYAENATDLAELESLCPNGDA